MTPARHALALALATLAFVIAFAAPAFAAIPVLWYAPVAHTWTFEVRPDGLAMDLYGRVLLATVAWLVAYALARPACRRWPRVDARALGVVCGWAGTALVFVALYYVWTLHFRVP